MPQLWCKWSHPNQVLSVKVRRSYQDALHQALDLQQDIKLRSISVNSRDLFLSIKNGYQRRTNQGTTRRSCRHPKETNFLRGRLLQNLLRWMENYFKDCQQPPQERQSWVRKDEDTHPSRGNGST